jgi:AcrR family transcriptional regulator
MSSAPRQRRPTRDETRARLIDAAVEVFVARGIAGASVEDITDAAGFSRGAFYSNFTDKDELVTSLIARMTDESVAQIEDNLARYPDPTEFVQATQHKFASPTPRIGEVHHVLSLELVLYAMRNPNAQPLLRERLDRHQEVIRRVVEHNAGELGLGPAKNRDALAAMIVAMDDGFSLHALIDPSRDPRTSFNIALDFLAEAGVAIAFKEHAEQSVRPAKRSTATKAASSASASAKRPAKRPAKNAASPKRGS